MPSFAAWSKIRPDFTILSGSKIEVTKKLLGFRNLQEKLENDFFVTSILKPLQMVKSCQIFDQVAKLGKASRDAYNPGLWIILYALLKNGVAEGVAFDPHDTKSKELLCHKCHI